MKTYGGVDEQTRVCLTSALGRSEWSASRPGRFTPGKEPPYSLHRGLGGPQKLSERRGEENILDPRVTRNPTCINRLLNKQHMHLEFRTPAHDLIQRLKINANGSLNKC
jgi:hypothetical protein